MDGVRGCVVSLMSPQSVLAPTSSVPTTPSISLNIDDFCMMRLLTMYLNNCFRVNIRPVKNTADVAIAGGTHVPGDLQ